MEPTLAMGDAAHAEFTTPQLGMPPREYSGDQLAQIVAALEEAFEPREIKWRVTNTTADCRRGQVVGYADSRAYTDRLNALFTVRGWTREYSVQVIQNFERTERGNAETRISGKVVVACRVTIAGLGAHSGLGEEWADNENAATAAEAQAFKRACACFGLGRYLYDLVGIWVDLDDKKQPRSRPKLPDWALPKHKPAANADRTCSSVPQGSSVDELKDRVKTLCGQVGFSLARSLTTAIAGTESVDGVRDIGVLAALASKLEDTLRGVERLRAAVAVVGDAKCSEICRALNFPGESLDDIPDRSALRQLIEALEREGGVTPMRQGREAVDGQNVSGESAVGGEVQSERRFGPGEMKKLGRARGMLLREAQRVARLKGLKLAEVVDRAAKGAFRFADLQRLTPEAVPALDAATQLLQRVA